MNKIILTGRLTKDPESKETESGSLITTIFLAVRREYKNKETNEYEADFIRLKSFNKQALYIHQYIKKGDLVQIDGSIRTGSYEKEGEKMYTTDYIISSINKLLSSNKDGQNNFNELK